MNVIIGMKELNTPLKWFGLRLFKAYDGGYYIKFKNQPRKRLFKQAQQRLSQKVAN